MAAPVWFRRILAHFDVPFEEIPHPAAFTAPELAEKLHVTGHRVAKTVFLVADHHPIAVVVPANTPVDLQRVQEVLGRPNARFATEAEIAGWFKGCEPGGVPPLRLRGDETIVMDRSMAHFGHLIFPAGSTQMAVRVRFRDWYRMVRPGTGRFTPQTNGKHHAPILVVEDEPDTNKLFCALLEREGFSCMGAEDGGGALKLASQVQPSAVLLDLMLPDMTGFEVYEQLRRTGPLKHMPLVVVTAMDDEAHRERGRQLGADAYLTKPFPPQELVKEVHEVLADCQV